MEESDFKSEFHQETETNICKAPTAFIVPLECEWTVP